MGYNVRMMEKAEEDLSEIVKYISDTLCNPKAAASLLEDFLKAKTNIEDNPYMYPLSKDELNYERLIKILSLYRLTLGQARQEELLEYLIQNEGGKENLEELFMNLSPYFRKN